MPLVWYRLFIGFITRFYFSRVKVIHPEHIPANGPILFLGLHRNGAVDGLVHHTGLERPEFMISTQLVGGWFSRLFFHGIAVTRGKDRQGERAANEAALGECLELLRGGGRLFIYPEGTSSLGPRHLPFKMGAFRLLLDYLDAGGPELRVIPVGVHYERAWAFRAGVEIVAGAAISTELPGATSHTERMRRLKNRAEEALAGVGINARSAEYQETIERIASISTVGTGRSWFRALKAMEEDIPPAVLEAWRAFELETGGLLEWHGVPLFPRRPMLVDAALLIIMGPIVLGAILLNLPPYLAGWIAAKRFADDRNVISLWKILAGVPILLVWSLIVLLILLVTWRPLALGAYGLITWLGWVFYDPAKRLAVSVLNAIRFPQLQSRYLALRELILQTLEDEY